MKNFYVTILYRALFHSLCMLWKRVNSQLRADPARQVSLDLVFVSANGFAFSLAAIRMSQTRMIPSEDAEATKYGSSDAPSLSFFVSVTTPLIRAG